MGRVGRVRGPMYTGRAVAVQWSRSGRGLLQCCRAVMIPNKSTIALSDYLTKEKIKKIPRRSFNTSAGDVWEEDAGPGHVGANAQSSFVHRGTDTSKVALDLGKKDFTLTSPTVNRCVIPRHSL